MLIRDPIHGDISLSPVEAQVLDLPDVQRLRGIKQLGTASLGPDGTTGRTPALGRTLPRVGAQPP